MAEFASNGKGNLGVALGAIGTGLGVIGPHVGNLFGWNNGYYNNGGGFVTKEAFELAQKNSALQSELALVKADQASEVKMTTIYERLEKQLLDLERAENQKWSDQSVYNATNTATVSVMANQLAQLQALTKLVVPADNVCPKPMPQFNSWTAPTA